MKGRVLRMERLIVQAAATHVASGELRVPKAFWVRLVQLLPSDASRVFLDWQDELGELELRVGEIHPVPRGQYGASPQAPMTFDESRRPPRATVRVPYGITKRVVLEFIERPDRGDDRSFELPEWGAFDEVELPGVTGLEDDDLGDSEAAYDAKDVGVVPCKGMRSGSWMFEAPSAANIVVSVAEIFYQGTDVNRVAHVIPLFMCPESRTPSEPTARHIRLVFPLSGQADVVRFRAWDFGDTGTADFNDSIVRLYQRELPHTGIQAPWSDGDFETIAGAGSYRACSVWNTEHFAKFCVMAYNEDVGNAANVYAHVGCNVGRNSNRDRAMVQVLLPGACAAASFLAYTSANLRWDTVAIRVNTAAAVAGLLVSVGGVRV